MSWTHSSKAVALGVLLAVALATAGTVGAVQISGLDEAPESAEVGETVTIDVELNELYGEAVPDDEWTLAGDTELENADWTIIVRDAGGGEEERQDVSGDTFQQDLDRDANHVSVDVSVTGEVPDMHTFNYEDASDEEITSLELSQVTGDDDRATLADSTHQLHRYTAESQEARQAIESAEDAAEEADSDSARDRIQDAITFYNNGEFDSAVNAAEDAESTAEGAEQTRQIMLFGGAGVLVVALLAAGVYYWRQSQEDRSKLQ